MKCQARQFSDQMNCALCGLVWDVNDPDPPGCAPKTRTIDPQRELAAARVQERTGVISAAERSRIEVNALLADVRPAEEADTNEA